MDFDWSKFIVRIPVNASVKKLYDAWATRRGIESWFLRNCEYKGADGVPRKVDELVHAGDTYAWLWYGYPDETEEHGSILDCNGLDTFKFKFGNAGICTIRILNENGQIIAELEQSQIPTDEKGNYNFHVGCKTGWTFYFANLKSVLEGGLDLRNRDEKIKNVINS